MNKENEFKTRKSARAFIRKQSRAYALKQRELNGECKIVPRTKKVSNAETIE